MWNETGATLEFSMAPAYYQARWFPALEVVSAFAAVWVAYRFRVRQVARAYPAKAITEGRDAVQSLRASTVERNDLAVAIRALSDELAGDPSAHQPPHTRCGSRRETRDLHPIARDEIYKITAEALRNACRHAHARRVEVEIHYDRQQFRMRVRDDGRGIDQAVLAGEEIEGHYGLRGMPERATLIGGKLAVWSEPGAGTEVELSSPARAVYATAGARSWWSRVF